jgi:tetrahedral aminopeptidase
LTDLWVDIGAKGKKEAEALVSVGDPMVLDQEVVALPNGRLAGRAFDDRAGAFVVLEAARMLAAMAPQAEIHAVGTVQEEIGSRGAITSAFGIDPQVGIAVDVTFATDHPMMDGPEKREGKVDLGGGPVLARGANINPVLYAHLLKTAHKRKIPVQIVADGRATPTDADPIQISRAGVAAALVSVPLRYMHTPSEVVSLDDLERTIELIAHAVAAMKPDQSWIPF